MKLLLQAHITLLPQDLDFESICENVTAGVETLTAQQGFAVCVFLILIVVGAPCPGLEIAHRCENPFLSLLHQHLKDMTCTHSRQAS